MSSNTMLKAAMMVMFIGIFLHGWIDCESKRTALYLLMRQIFGAKSPKKAGHEG